MTARSAADLARANRKTAAYFFHRFRQIIARQLEDSLPVEGLVEVDERYFRGVRKGKRGRGGAGEIPVFGILKRRGKVTTVMIPDVRKDTLLPILSSSGRSFGFDRLHRLLSRYESSTSPSSITTGSTTRTPTFSIATITSMESRTSGTRPSARSAVTTAFRKPTFPSFSRKLNFASTSEHRAPQTLGQTQGLANPIWDNPFPICSFTGTTGAHWRQILTNLQSVHVVRLMTIGKQAFSPPTPSKAGLSASPLQIIQKRLRTTTFGLQIFLDSVF